MDCQKSQKIPNNFNEEVEQLTIHMLQDWIPPPCRQEEMCQSFGLYSSTASLKHRDHPSARAHDDGCSWYWLGWL